MKTRTAPVYLPLITLTLLAPLGVGCTDDPTEPVLPEPVEIEWSDCPSEWPEWATASAQCATFDVPLRWDEPEEQRISIGVMRVLASEGPSSGQLWLLDGGPGGTGFRFLDPGLASLFAPTGLDLYIPVHRGTLAPWTTIECSSPSNVDCASELLANYDESLLTGFTGIEAGRDVGYLIDEVHTDDTPVFVFGGSYGTHWVLRYLRAYPDQATGAILDGTLHVSEQLPFARTMIDGAVARLLDGCAADDTCRAALGDDPMATLAGVFEAVESGACPAGLTRADLSLLLGDLLGHSYDGARVMLGVASRLARCEADDLAQMGNLLQNLGAVLGFPFPIPDDLDYSLMHSQAVNLAVVGNEIAAPFIPFPADEVAVAESQQLVLGGSGTSPSGLQELNDIWPSIELPADFFALPETSVPMLLLAGGIDLNAPLPMTEAVAANYAGPTTTRVTFPHVGHVTLFQTTTSFGSTCAVEIVAEFVASHASGEGTAPDTSCVAEMPPFDFAGTRDSTRDLAMTAFGVPDLHRP